MAKRTKYTPAEKAYIEADNALNREQEKQINIFYAASAVVWWRSGWKKQRIMKRFTTSMLAWDECGTFGTKKSMLQLLEEETGIELTLTGYDRSWHELAFLDDSAWNGKIPSIHYMTEVRKKQKPWVALCVFAGICLALHRDEKYGYERLSRYIQDVDQIRQELGEDIEKYKKLMLDVTGIDLDKLWTDREEWGE